MYRLLDSGFCGLVTYSRSKKIYRRLLSGIRWVVAATTVLMRDGEIVSI